eukprot:NODE_2385_length_558_cov_224.850688_g1893_i0.p1 GENE.NODE_2385_length_558_cov_224.850688_g1893_i0~~NODE_2385_length_558_cov_224.850688_g1893_i0.p1  ORF type:complete len:139 (-),score=34.96 NODE_2385_length_558_cov_224.850688_g1893_i0:141-500(-)
MLCSLCLSMFMLLGVRVVEAKGSSSSSFGGGRNKGGKIGLIVGCVTCGTMFLIVCVVIAYNRWTDKKEVKASQSMSAPEKSVSESNDGGVDVPNPTPNGPLDASSIQVELGERVSAESK